MLASVELAAHFVIFSFPAADAHDPFVDFIPKGPVTTGALAQEQGFKSDVRCLMTLQDVHKGCVQLLEFRHGNRAHIDGKFHIRRNGIDRASPLMVPTLYVVFGVWGTRRP